MHLFEQDTIYPKVEWKFRFSKDRAKSELKTKEKDIGDIAFHIASNTTYISPGPTWLRVQMPYLDIDIN